MTNPALKPTPPHSNPLEQLHDALEQDMEAVNAFILERLESPVEMIPQVAKHLIAAGGKRIRPLMTLACTAMYGGEIRRAHRLAAAVEFIHSATLLHDDVVDESDTRRGLKTANMIFGNKTSVLVGDFLFSRSFQMMVEDGNLEILRVLSDASAIIAQGEVLQLATTNNVDTSMAQYLDVIRAKTAALFAAACQVGPMIAGASHDAAASMAEYGLHLGIAFQIADDALDYAGEAAALGKTIGDDFFEGKMTAPVILALQKAGREERSFWTRCLTHPTREAKDLETAQTYLQKSGALEASIKLAEDYAEKARLALAEGPDSPLRAQLDALALYAVQRVK